MKKLNYLDLINTELGGKHYNILSYKAIYNMLLMTRNKGKTTCLIAWRTAKFIKYGKTTTWVRVFKNELKKCKRNPIKKLVIKILDEQYHIKAKLEDFKVVGDSLCYKNKPYINYVRLGAQRSEKSNDDDNEDCLVFDEFTQDYASLRRYRGNFVEDFNNLFISKKRQKQYRVFLLGNAETPSNPLFNYFGIDDITSDFEGVKTYRNGAILVAKSNEFIEDTSQISNDYDKKMKSLFAGTSFDKYLREGATLSNNVQFIKKMPATTRFYASFIVNNYRMSAFSNGYDIYIIKGIDESRRVINVIEPMRLKNAYLLSSSDKKYFSKLAIARKANTIYYDTEATADAFNLIIKTLNL